MDLTELHHVAAERAARWESAAAVHVVTNGPVTDKPAAWLDLTTATTMGRLIVWTSGEAEMEWGQIRMEGQRHYDLVDGRELRACVDDLERVLGLREDPSAASGSQATP